MFHPWGFWFDISIGSKHFSFHVSILLLQGLPSARLARKTSQHENWKCFSPIEKSFQSLPETKNTIFFQFLSFECSPKFNKLGALFNRPILCFCFLCSVIWSLKSANWEDNVLTNSWVASNWLCRVLHSFVSPSTSSTAKDIARSLGNQSKHFSCKKIKM